MSLQPTLIAGSSIGLKNDTKPFLSPDQSFSDLQNAYVFRERVRKREGFEFVGRLRRFFEDVSLGNSGASPWIFNIYAVVVPPIVPEANAEIDPGHVTITIQAGPDIVFTDFDKAGTVTNITQANPGVVTTGSAHNLTDGDTVTFAAVGGMTEVNGQSYVITVISANTFSLNDTNTIPFTAYTVGGTWTAPTAQGNGILVSPTPGNSGTINYLTGAVVLITTAAPGSPTIATFGYFPALPVMGIWQRDIANINDEQTIFWDTKYAYEFAGNDFVEFIPGTTWASTDSDFFWATNYRGIEASDRLFFETNFINNAANPMRYTDGITWTDFHPVVSQSGALISRRYITSARIIIPYYGRLLLLNTWESGADVAGNPDYSSPLNFFNRCSFSQIGNPIEPYDNTVNPKTGAFAIDIFGKGGFIDAPTNEAIISAAFLKNTLIVFFERSTWQLRYVGEYGLPFLWERISSDFGSESTFSTVMFDNGVLAVGDRAIVTANPVTVQRIDPQIPDQVFKILNDQNGVKRVIGIRDFQRELVFWAYPDFTSLAEGQYFPNKVIVYNYQNNTYAIFDDNVTFFGTLQPPTNITWSSTDVFWHDDDTLWDDVNLQNFFPRIVAGNQEGFVGYYGYVLPDETSLAISAINLAIIPNQITVINHNLQGQEDADGVPSGEVIRITDAIFDGAGDPGLNDNFYLVQYIDVNTLALFYWTGTTYAALQLTPAGTYIGSGRITVFPRLLIRTKDFNPYMTTGLGLKLSRVDFLFDATANSAVSIILLANSSPSIEANLLVGNRNINTNLPSPYYGPGSEYAWHQFFATASAQFISLVITYNEALMNDITTHRSNMVMNAFTLWTRPGGRISA